MMENIFGHRLVTTRTCRYCKILYERGYATRMKSYISQNTKGYVVSTASTNISRLGHEIFVTQLPEPDCRTFITAEIGIISFVDVEEANLHIHLQPSEYLVRYLLRDDDYVIEEEDDQKIKSFHAMMMASSLAFSSSITAHYERGLTVLKEMWLQFLNGYFSSYDYILPKNYIGPKQIAKWLLELYWKYEAMASLLFPVEQVISDLKRFIMPEHMHAKSCISALVDKGDFEKDVKFLTLN